MAKINLLPWREERREQKKKEFIAVSTGVALLGVILSGLVWMFYNNQLDEQNAANQLVVAENARLEVQLKELDGLQARRDEILERMKLIQDLQGVRPVIVHVYDEITKLTPSSMYLTEFSRDADRFTLIGKAQDPNVISDYLRALGSSPWFRNAFMKSFEAVEAKPQLPGGVAPRPEDSYGKFEVTVDLGDVSTILASTQASEAFATDTSSTNPATTEVTP